MKTHLYCSDHIGAGACGSRAQRTTIERGQVTCTKCQRILAKRLVASLPTGKPAPANDPIETLLARPIGGNYVADAPLLSALDNYAKDPRYTVSNRARAIRHIDKVMGLGTVHYTGSQALDQILLDEFLANARENGEPECTCYDVAGMRYKSPTCEVHNG